MITSAFTMSRRTRAWFSLSSFGSISGAAWAGVVLGACGSNAAGRAVLDGGDPVTALARTIVDCASSPNWW